MLRAVLLEVINGDQWLLLVAMKLRPRGSGVMIFQAWSDKAVDAKSYSAGCGGHQIQSLMKMMVAVGI